MIAALEFTTTLGALLIAFFGLSQAWLALNYRHSKAIDGAAKAAPVWVGPMPRVLLQLPIYNERYVVDRLLRAAARVDYPRELLTIQLLDDSTDETTAIAAATITDLAKQGIKIEHVRRADRSGYKAGALQAGLALNDSEFIAIFDADFIIQPDFIKRIIGYFKDPKIGMVQTRWSHLNANYSLLTKILAFGIDAHFSMEQGGRQASESFINFNGTAGMWRRKTIDNAGGWSSDCLTEDLDLSFRSQLKDWKLLFVEAITTPSELPVEMSAIRSQQFRWCKGALEAGRKNLPPLWRSNFPLKAKIVGTFHMMNVLIFPGVLLLSILAALYVLIFGHAAEKEFMWVSLLLGVGTVSAIFAYATAQTHGQFKDRNSNPVNAAVAAFNFMLLTSGLGVHNSIAVIQGILGKATPFVRTPKLNITDMKQDIVEKRAYSLGALSPIVFAEIAVALFFTGLTLYCLLAGMYYLVLVYGYFAAGYVMVCVFTVGELLNYIGHSGQKTTPK